MELKHDNVKKEAIKEPKVSKVRAFAAAAVMAGGLALLGAGSAKAQDTTKFANLDCGSVPSVNIVCMANKSVVKAGDPVLTIEFLSEQAGVVSFDVAKVDNKGVVLTSKAEIFMSEQTAPSFRVNFGESKPLMGGTETVLPEFNYVVTAEKGPKPGTAKITVTTSVYTMLEQFGNYLSEAMSAAGGVVQTAQDYQKKFAKLDCSNPGVNIICLANKSVLEVGDPVLAIEFVFEKAGFFFWNVTKIDSKGIEIGGYMEIFMSEHATNKPFRVNFGETKSIPSKFGLDSAISVEKGLKPGTAIVSVVAAKQDSE